MADRVRFMIHGALEHAAVAANSEVSGLPASNVVDTLIRKTYRTRDRDSEWITFDAGSDVDVNCVFIGRHNLTKDAVITWEGDDSSLFANPPLSTRIPVVVDLAEMVVPKLTYFYGTTQTYRYWRLRIEDMGNQTRNLEIGRVMAGVYYEPERDLLENYTIEHRDPSRMTRIAGRHGYANVRPRYMRLQYNLFDLSEDGWDELYGIYQEVGRYRAFLMAINPETRPSEDTMYCQFASDISRQQRVLRQYNLQEVFIEEKN